MKKIKWLSSILLSAIMVVSLLIPTTMVSGASKKKIGLNYSNITISVGASKQLQVTGTKKKITWKTSKKSIVTVNKEGKITGKKVGKATITAKVSGKSYKCKVTVKAYLTKTKVDLVENESISIALKGEKIKSVKSSNKSVATVTKAGEITGKKAGQATITVTSTKNNKYTCKVTVKQNKCTVKFNSNGGSSVSSITVTKGKSISEPPKPTKKGYIFTGWYTSKKLDNAFLFNSDKVSSNITLYAGWVKDNPDDIAIDNALGDIIIEYQTGDSASSITGDITLPTKIDSYENVSITWTSSNPEIITQKGNVTRPKETDTVVTLTATAKQNSSSASKKFELTVIHQNDRTSSDISNNSVLDIERMNTEEDVNIEYNDNMSQVTSIEGQYSDIIVENVDDAVDVVQNNHTILGVNNPYDELDISTTNSDEYGSEYRFSQVYGDYEVYARSITVSTDDEGKTDSLSSDFYASEKLNDFSLTPSLTQNEAEEAAVNLYGNDCTADTDNTSLVIYTLYQYEDDPILTYIVPISGTDNEGNAVEKNVFINAANGDFVADYDTSIDDTVTGSGNDEMGNRVSFPINFTWTDFYFYYMYNVDSKVQIYKRTLKERVGSEFNIWTDGQEISAYVNMTKVMNWWKSTYNRNSLDNNGMKVNVVTHQLGLNTNNAFWRNSDKSIHITDISGNIVKYSRAVAEDVLTHESTHAVLSYEIGSLASIYKDATGAINEGYGDIFGCLQNRNWTHGENLYTKDSKNNGVRVTCTRNIANPGDTSALSQGPDKLSSSLYVQPGDSDDNGGVHTNSFLISHAAYLMYKYGLTWDTLEKLWYKSIYMGYDTQSDYFTVRKNVLKAANKIGLTNKQITIIKKAFDEEEIYGDQGTMTGTITDKNGNPISNATVTFTKDDVVIGNTTTNANGIYKMKLETGKVDVKISKNGYISSSVLNNEIKKDYTSTLNVILVKEGTGTVYGTILSATVKDEKLEGVTINARKGWNTYSGTIVKKCVTGEDGAYEFKLDAGYYTLELILDGYTNNYINITIYPDTKTQMIGTLSSTMPSSKYRVVLTWGESPSDLDSHLEGQTSDGTDFHIYYANKKESDSNGNEIGNLDVDDTSSYGPETITFSIDTEGTYHYYVNRYSSGNLPASSAHVEVYNGDADIPFTTYDIDPNQDADSTKWHIFTIKNGIYISDDIVNNDSSEW